MHVASEQRNRKNQGTCNARMFGTGRPKLDSVRICCWIQHAPPDGVKKSQLAGQGMHRFSFFKTLGRKDPLLQEKPAHLTERRPGLGRWAGRC